MLLWIESHPSKIHMLKLCGTKISPVMSINKKYHSHQWFLASKSEWGLPKLQSSWGCHLPWWWLKTWGNAKSIMYYSSKRTRKQNLATDSWVSCSVVPDSCDQWSVTCQGPLSLEFSRQEYWSGLPFPYAGDLPNLRIEPRSPTLQADSLPSEPRGKPQITEVHVKRMNSVNPETCIFP